MIDTGMGLVAERTNVHHYGGLIGLFSSSIEIPYIVNPTLSTPETFLMSLCSTLAKRLRKREEVAGGPD